MRAFLLPVAAAAIVLSCAVGFAADNAVSGEVQAVDTAAMTVTLTDGSVFKLPADYDEADLVPGAQVTVEWSGTDDAKTVVSISFEE